MQNELRKWLNNSQVPHEPMGSQKTVEGLRGYIKASLWRGRVLNSHTPIRMTSSYTFGKELVRLKYCGRSDPHEFSIYNAEL